MRARRLGLLSRAVVVTLLLLLASSSLVSAKTIVPGEPGGRPLVATLTGAAEVPDPGDPDGSGSAVVTLNQGQGQVCFHVQFAGIEPVQAAHIHVAPAGEPGPVVVSFNVVGPVESELQGCVSADPALIKAIRQNPQGYYVNVHNDPFPGGALRGQLSK